ncbi:hypothetical protein QTI24_05585 [Variovorax sp. J22P240]|uniref:hypothetical protein n=1 Tax=Variovorax sp. J22P240 TaxID=3053514 RepID=UPI002576FD95|nr:hypothetical protein [Variovorax sp. J22P240]MDL9998066.1 hypothetical protein [Variovorax sp. J22P240]
MRTSTAAASMVPSLRGACPVPLVADIPKAWSKFNSITPVAVFVTTDRLLACTNRPPP